MGMKVRICFRPLRYDFSMETKLSSLTFLSIGRKTPPRAGATEKQLFPGLFSRYLH